MGAPKSALTILSAARLVLPAYALFPLSDIWKMTLVSKEGQGQYESHIIHSFLSRRLALQALSILDAFQNLQIHGL